jgi:hypothetical protein
MYILKQCGQILLFKLNIKYTIHCLKTSCLKVDTVHSGRLTLRKLSAAN